ncbi:hypothetical protein BKA25_002092 [Actinoalloteichus hymeniacidonis]|uniref:DUF4132 family protein n=1 Tax=Actinoalloteichus hymeniacidonis TaxID=340345 RepID=A0AAC9MZK0_9PSEU|nr:putative DUF4132 family protein [Actinoalloteichus hymeniacidonis]MBB5907776.1 hypothetical protein [Actinoalloteichus hymeniacidonis]
MTAWGEQFADYEILQPFPQLARTSRGLTDEEAAGHTLTRFEGAEVPIGKLLSLATRGWDRDMPGDGGGVYGFSRRLPDGSVVQIGFEPGYAVGYPAGSPRQRLAGVGIDSHRTGRTLGQLSPVAVAELIYEAERLVG